MTATWTRDTPWRQGHLLTTEAALALGLSHPESPDSTCVVVISHDCDLANDALHIEPDVEVIVGRRLQKGDGNYFWSKAPRTLHIDTLHNGIGACLLECVIAGSVVLEKLHRTKIARILRGNSLLSARLQRARTDGAKGPVWTAENDRVSRVALKLARCHAAFELNEPQLHDPSHLGIKPLPLMTEDEREAFECDGNALDVWPEVGSRAMQRMLVTGTDAFVEGWVTVQEGNYRFRTSQANGLTVKIVLREYLGCEIIWD